MKTWYGCTVKFNSHLFGISKFVLQDGKDNKSPMEEKSIQFYRLLYLVFHVNKFPVSQLRGNPQNARLIVFSLISEHPWLSDSACLNSEFLCLSACCVHFLSRVETSKAISSRAETHGTPNLVWFRWRQEGGMFHFKLTGGCSDTTFHLFEKSSYTN